MNISLNPRPEKFVQQKMENEMYTSASKVVRESSRLMHTYNSAQKQQITQLNQAISIGMQQLADNNKMAAEESYVRLKRKVEKLICKPNKPII